MSFTPVPEFCHEKRTPKSKDQQKEENPPIVPLRVVCARVPPMMINKCNLLLFAELLFVSGVRGPKIPTSSLSLRKAV